MISFYDKMNNFVVACNIYDFSIYRVQSNKLLLAMFFFLIITD